MVDQLHTHDAHEDTTKECLYLDDASTSGPCRVPSPLQQWPVLLSHESALATAPGEPPFTQWHEIATRRTSQQAEQQLNTRTR